MSIIRLKPRNVSLPILSSDALDDSKVIHYANNVRVRHYVHDLRNFCELRLKIPAGAEIVGIILGKYSDPVKTVKSTGAFGSMCETDSPIVMDIDGESNQIFLNEKRRKDNAGKKSA